MATKPAAGGMVNGKGAPPAFVVVNDSEVGGVTFSDLPVIVMVAKLVRLPVLAITVIVCVLLKAGGVNGTVIAPELFVLKVPKENT